MTYDFPTACVCIGIGLELFALHALTNPKNRVWADMPWYERIGYFVAGALMVFRGVDLLGLASPALQPVVGGHINLDGLVAALSLFYLFGAKVVAHIRQTFPARIWDRIKYIKRLAQCRRKGPAMADLALHGVTVIEPRGRMPPP